MLNTKFKMEETNRKFWILGILFIAMIITISIASSVIVDVESNNTTKPNIDPEILEELNETSEVSVIVKLKDNSGIKYENDMSKSRRYDTWQKRQQYFKTIRESTLSNLSIPDFKIKYKLSRGFTGNVTKEGLAKLLDNSKIESIFIERVLHVTLDESGPLIRADDVKTLGYNGSGNTVCVVDSGIDYNHKDLGGCFGSGCKVRGGFDFFNNDADPIDDNGHGTHVAGIVASENSVYEGIAPGADLVALKACSSTGSCSSSAITAAID